MKLHGLKKIPISRADPDYKKRRRDHVRNSGGGLIPHDLERAEGKTEFMQVNYLSRGVLASKAVCQLIVADAELGKLNYGTGFLITPRLLITNHHVISTEQQALDTRVIFDKERDAFGNWEKRKEFRLNPGMTFITNKELDYSIIAIEEKSIRGDFETKEFNFLRLNPDIHKIEESEYVSVIQHPEEGNVSQKYIAVRAGRVLKIGKHEIEDKNSDDIEDKYLWYSAETLRGSSGSPVLNDQWQVVAIHHKAVPETKTVKNELFYKKSNNRWVKIKNNPNDFINANIIANQGIRTSVIIEDIKEKLLEIVNTTKRKFNNTSESKVLLAIDENSKLLNELLEDVKANGNIEGFSKRNSIGIYIHNRNNK